jgi:O-antigen/teichoic acid export membrane protein
MSERAGTLGGPGPRPVLRHLLVVNAALGVPTWIALCAASPLIMAAYGASFEDAWPAFVVLQAAALLQLMQAPLLKLWVATGRMWTSFAVNVLWAGTVLGVTYLLISRGAAGLALGQLAGFVVCGLALVGLSRRRWRSG